jgi:hypothetical protein
LQKQARTLAQAKTINAIPDWGKARIAVLESQ